MQYFKTFYKRIFLLLLIYSSSRIIFYFLNNEYFSSNILASLFEGIRFDISALFYINAPILILLLFPTNLRKKTAYQKITNIIFYCINIPFLLINNADIEYYRFSLKRTTADIFDYLSLGGGADAFEMIPKYLADYWHITIIIIIQIFLLIKIKFIPSEKIQSYIRSISLFILSIGIFILGARGGFPEQLGGNLKPIKPIDAGLLSNLDNSVLVLNSPFCILHTFLESGLNRHSYFKKKEMDIFYNTTHHFSEKNFLTKYSKEDSINIVIIILESFSEKFIGRYNDGNGYTPFLDKLMNHSLIAKNGYSNGIKSIEALPAITASIPTLMDNPFITSPYATNEYYGIGSILKKEGYSTSFFHGGKQGTMGFYQFSKRSGFDNYFGMKEYGTNKDYDGSWGIYDEPFFNYYAEYLNSEENPFMSCIFSISSHHPYTLPKNKQNIFPKGELEIHESIGYTDFALKKFFEYASQQEWYKKTLFVITADHTAAPEKGKNIYENKIDRYSIPIIYFMGDSSIQGTNTTITQQIDIMPTILDIIGYNKKFFSFGKSLFREQSWAISFINNEYLLINEYGALIGRNEKYTAFDKNLKRKGVSNIDITNLLKSIKQKYNNRLINNQLTINEN